MCSGHKRKVKSHHYDFQINLVICCGDRRLSKRAEEATIGLLAGKPAERD